MDMILGKCKFPNSFYLIFRNICCRYSLELPHVYLQHMIFQLMSFFTISFSKTNSQPLSFIQRNEHVEMNNFSCSLSCTWVTIIDCLFDASGNLS